MAEEKKTPEKQGWFKKLISWIASLPGRIAKAFKNMVAELRKVTWPSKKKLISSCITVLLFMLVVGAVVSLLDVGSAAVVNGLYTIGHPDSGSTTTPGATPTNINVTTGTDAQGEPAPVEGEPAPVEGEPAPVEGEPAPVEGEPAPVEENETTGTDEDAAETAE